MASGHTTMTSAMPSSSTLHYAAKQLDDTVINNRTQPLDRQLNTSPPAKQLDEISWFKSWQLTPPQQSLLRSNCNMPTHAGRHVRTIANRPPCSRTPPGQLSNPEDECTRVSPERRSPPSLSFATRITRYNIILGKNGLKPSVPLDTARMRRLPPQKEQQLSVLRFPLSNKSHLFRMIPQRRSIDQRTRSALLLTSLRRDALHVGSIHDSDDAIKAVHGLHVVNHEEGLSTN